MGIFSILGCKKNKKIYFEDKEFIKIESSFKVDMNEALNIYETTFFQNFNIEKKEEQVVNQERVIYIENGYYYIGYVSKYDKRGKRDGHLYFLVKINSESGEISIVENL